MLKVSRVILQLPSSLSPPHLLLTMVGVVKHLRLDHQRFATLQGSCVWYWYWVPMVSGWFTVLWKRKSLSCLWYFPETVSKLHEKYFPFNEVAGKSRSSSSTANYYCVEKCVIFTNATVTSQSMDSTWTHVTRRTHPKLTKTFLFWVTVTNSPSFPGFLMFFQNSLSFPWLDNWKLIFKDFPWFPVAGNPVLGSAYFYQTHSGRDYWTLQASWKLLHLAATSGSLGVAEDPPSAS